MEPDIRPYLDSIYEIRYRINVVESFINNKVKFQYHPPKVESIVLQVRKILELIALSSLAANKEHFENNQIKFHKKWRVAKIMKSIEAVNPGFYPQPIIEKRFDDDKIPELINREEGYLTKEDLVAIHGKCGNLLHASNPYHNKPDYDYYLKEIPKWMDKIVYLLLIHKIQLLDTKFYLIRFLGKKDVSYNVFEIVDK